LKTLLAALMRTSNSINNRAAMAQALALGRRGLGRVWPNPAVGCVIIDVNGRLAGRGWTQPGGRPHAETEALGRAKDRASGGTAFVTLEPCSHRGQTPPCAEALITSGIARVVVATADPDDRVSGRGLEMLRAAGVVVELGLGEAEARFDQAGFLSKVEQGRPLIALKTAMSLDGRIAVSNGDSKWITGPESRRRGHLLRAEYDAILVGVGTALADDPRLDCRVVGLESTSSLRIVLDSALRLGLDLDLVQNAATRPTWVFCAEGADTSRRVALEAAGVRVFPTAVDGEGRVDLDVAMERLAQEGVTRLLIEGGGMVAAGMLRRDLVDRIYGFRAPMVVGADGVAAIGPLRLERVTDSPRFTRRMITAADDDLCELYVRVGR
jgi:diaminohydroxyphosphoribosylaminopyrimidine deaminase/5-amino-6-(5-phosphoribosylamino)uracil reductase